MKLKTKALLWVTVGCSALLCLALLLHLSDSRLQHASISPAGPGTSLKTFGKAWPSQDPSRTPGSKRTNVVFLKTHKTASSTVQNILFRFAERHNLTVALPVEACQHQFCYPRLFSVGAVHRLTPSPNILTNHMRFHGPELRRLMPRDSVYVTIMREPGAMFESLFVYCRVSSRSFQRVPDKSLRTFLDHPWRYYRAHEADSAYARNCVTFDLGGDKDEAEETYPERFAAQVRETFQLVMIAEYFDESLILLRHLLNWELDDLVYFKLNMRTEKSKQNLTSDLLAKIRAWNSIDSYLYDYFNSSLWRQLSALGVDSVRKEVSQLRGIQQRYSRSCFGGQGVIPRLSKQIADEDTRPWQPGADVDVIGYELAPSGSRARCLRLITPELQYSAALLRSQTALHRHRLREPVARGKE